MEIYDFFLAFGVLLKKGHRFHEKLCLNECFM